MYLTEKEVQLIQAFRGKVMIDNGYLVMTHNHFTIGVLKNDLAVTNGDPVVEFDKTMLHNQGVILDLNSKKGIITEDGIPNGDEVNLFTRPAYEMDCTGWRKYFAYMGKATQLPNALRMNYIPPFYASPCNGDRITLHTYWGYIFYTIKNIPNFVGLLGTGKLSEENVTSLPNWLM